MKKRLISTVLVVLLVLSSFSCAASGNCSGFWSSILGNPRKMNKSFFAVNKAFHTLFTTKKNIKNGENL